MSVSNPMDGNRNPTVARALRRIYPKLTVYIDRLIRSRRVTGLEASDVCQDAILAAALYLNGLGEDRVSSFDDNAACAMLFSVAARAAHGKIVDYLRWSDRRRRQIALEPPASDGDESFQRQQEARALLERLLQGCEGATFQALSITLEIGEVDAEVIAARAGISKAYAYKLLQRLSEQARMLR
jgi:DNA-directed RNA polymerase specialized sigma24 family protein